MKKTVVLTGDRPTGPLHLGHYVGSLQNRTVLQNTHDQFIMVADMQALTDNADNPEKVSSNIFEVLCDYLAVGIDPSKSTFFIQSLIPAIAELTIIYMNLVTVARVQRNPTVKTEIQQKGFGQSIPVGFFVYPIHQAADITVVKGELVPVGEDQLPMIEQTNEIVRSFNRIYKKEVLVEAQALISQCPRLPGIDGQAKMGKSLNNAIYLKDSADELAKKVRSMYTDPNHIKVEDPGSIEGNTVFTYLDVFAQDKAHVQALKDHYQKGGLGDMKVKNYLLEVLEGQLAPIRERRKMFEQDKSQVMRIALEGSAKVFDISLRTIKDVKEAMGINYSKF